MKWLIAWMILGFAFFLGILYKEHSDSNRRIENAEDAIYTLEGIERQIFKARNELSILESIPQAVINTLNAGIADIGVARQLIKV
jgi:archaellum component FlaF (FlaF/FlaG flagellin family)